MRAGAIAAFFLVGAVATSVAARPVFFHPEVALTLDPAGLGYTHLPGASSIGLNAAGALDVCWPNLTLGVVSAVSVAAAVDSDFIGAHAGFAWDWRRMRVELLGEAGAHRLSISESGAVDSPLAWLPYMGVSPTVTFRLPVHGVRMLLRLQMQALFDLDQRKVPADVSPLTPVTFGGYALLWNVGVGVGF